MYASTSRLDNVSGIFLKFWKCFKSEARGIISIAVGLQHILEPNMLPSSRASCGWKKRYRSTLLLDHTKVRIPTSMVLGVSAPCGTVRPNY